MIRQLLVARASEFEFIDPKKAADPAGLLLQVEQRLRELLAGFGKQQVLGVPSADWELYLTQKTPDELPSPDRVVISVALDDPAAVDEFRNAVADANKRGGDRPPFPGVGADLSLAGSEYFCPANADQILFGDRKAAAALTHSRDLQQRGLTGKNVNIVVVDEGFDKNMVRNFGGGLIHRPSAHPASATRPGDTKRGHGIMMVRNILHAAPDATFYDVPLIPARISNVTGFVANALGAFMQLLVKIAFLRRLGIPPWNGPWVFVNAWSAFNRDTEYPRGSYTRNPNHPLNLTVDAMVNDGTDLVFAAGNCGQFCPDRRCGRHDVGPGNSIHGANSLQRVLTVGAVRTDARWMGNSSQGPGQMAPGQQKPDLCAPSFFREVDDASLGNLSRPLVENSAAPYVANTGTSAACGVAAGIVAAIRSGWGPSALPPQSLISCLAHGALKTEGPAWNQRLGHGIIDVKGTLPLLPPRPAA